MSQAELQKAHQEQLQRVAKAQQTGEIAYECFKKCMKSPDVVRLSSGEESCFLNCATRRLEASQISATRVAAGRYLSLQ